MSDDPYTREDIYLFTPKELMEFVEKSAYIAQFEGEDSVARLQGEETLQWLESRKVDKT